MASLCHPPDAETHVELLRRSRALPNSLIPPWTLVDSSTGLTSYDGGPKAFMSTPLQEMVEQIEAGTLPISIGKTFKLDEIVEAHRTMEENKAGGKIVVLP